MANVISIERLNERDRVEHLDDGANRIIIQRGQHYFDRDTNRFEDSPARVTADDQVPGFSHRYKAQHWSRFGRGQWKIGFGQGRSIIYKPRAAANVAPVVSGRVVIYRVLWPGVDAELTAFPEGVKEDLVLKDPGAPSSFIFDVELSGVTIVQDGQSLQVLETLTGDVVGRIPAPTVHDAAGVSGPATLTYAAGAIRIAVDPAWLADSARAWPVTLDPTTITIQPDPTAGIDTYIDSGNVTGNFGTLTNIAVGYADIPIYRGLLQFDLSSLVAGNGVSAADLWLNGGGATPTVNITVHKILQSWAETGVTWSTAPSHDATAVATTAVGVSAWYSWGIASLVRGWRDSSVPNYGVMLKGDEATANTNKGFSSSDYTTDITLRPKLVVTQTAAPVPTLTTPAGTQAAPTQISNDVTPTLSGTYSSSDSVAQSKYRFRIFDELNNLIADQGLQSGTTNSWTAPAAYLKYGQKYKVEFYVEDVNGGYATTTAWMQSVMSAPTGLAATADPANARINLAWTAHTGENLAGYNLYRKLQGAPDADYKKINLSLLTGTSTVDNTAASGQGYTYALTAVATDGYESVKSTGANATVTFTGYWLDGANVKLREPPHFSRERRVSRRLALDGTWQVQDQGWAAPQVELAIRFASLAERDSILALFPAGIAVSYRDEQGFVLRGEVTSQEDEERFKSGAAVYGTIRLTLTEVSA